MDSKIEQLTKELEGIQNTMWAYKFEYNNLNENERNEALESLGKSERLLQAKIKAIEIKEKLKDL